MDDSRILDVWGAGRLDPAGRSLLMLAAAHPDVPVAEHAAWPLGQRNRMLLADRLATFGDRIDGEAICPDCGERLEVGLRLSDLLSDPEVAGADVGRPEGASVEGAGVEGERADVAEVLGAGGEVRVGDVMLRYRLPTSADLQAASGCPDADAAAQVLLQRCVLSARRGGELLPVAGLPDRVLEVLDATLGRHDPHADLRLTTTCVACGHAFDLWLEPGELYWAELSQRAQRLLGEVHRLATAYGWSEREILQLDPARREAYLELVG